MNNKTKENKNEKKRQKNNEKSTKKRQTENRIFCIQKWKKIKNQNEQIESNKKEKTKAEE